MGETDKDRNRDVGGGREGAGYTKLLMNIFF